MSSTNFAFSPLKIGPALPMISLQCTLVVENVFNICNSSFLGPAIPALLHFLLGQMISVLL